MSTQSQYMPLHLKKSLSSAGKDDDPLSSESLMLASRHRSSSRPQTPNDEDMGANRGEDGDPMTFRRAMVLIAMSFLWTASQIPLYFYGGIEPQILKNIGGYKTYVWIGLGNLIPLGVVTPFVGALSDLFGRKNIGMASFGLIILGNVVCAISKTMNVFIIGSVFMGVGAGMGELISLAVAGEIAPTKNRGIYIGGMIMTIVPFCPAVLYAQLITCSSTWRWVGLIIGAWSFIGLVVTFAFYWPPPRRSEFTRRKLLEHIDYLGGILSGAGITLFLIGLTFPTEGYRWNSPLVLANVILGLCFIIAFVVWEWQFARYPMFPARLKEKNLWVLAILLLVTAVSGANFFAVLINWPSQYQNVYAQNNAVSQGIGALPVGLGIIFGSIIVTALVSILKGKIRILMIISSVLMTAGSGAMAAATLTNLSLVWFIISLACVGVGAVIVPNQVIAGIVCPDDLIATITAATIAARIIGGAIAYAIYYDVLTLKFISVVPKYIAPAAVSVGINSTKKIDAIAVLLRGGGYEQLSYIPGVDTQHQIDVLTYAGKEALVASYPLVYFVSIAFGVVAIIASCFLTGIEEQMKSGVAVKIM